MTQVRRCIAAVFALFMMIVVSPTSFADEAAAVAQTVASQTLGTQSLEPVAQTQSVVNINTADAATLAQHLKGVGQTKAQAIVDYRDANGSFGSADDLIHVKGIGAATIEKNAAVIVVE